MAPSLKLTIRINGALPGLLEEERKARGLKSINEAGRHVIADHLLGPIQLARLLEQIERALRGIETSHQHDTDIHQLVADLSSQLTTLRSELLRAVTYGR